MGKKREKVVNHAFRDALGEEAYEAYIAHLAAAGAKGGKARVPKGFAITHKQENRYQRARKEREDVSANNQRPVSENT